MLNITTVSQVWNCLLRPINKTALTCARNAANSGFWIEPQIMKRGWSCIVIHWGHAMCWFSYQNKTKNKRKVVYINVWLWLKIHGGFHWTGNDVVSQPCMQARLSAALQKQSSALSVPGCPNRICTAGHWNYLLLKKMDVKTMLFIYIFLWGFFLVLLFFLILPLSHLSTVGFFFCFFVLTKLSESQKARQIKRICYHLEFFF